MKEEEEENIKEFVGNWGFKSTHCSSAYPIPSKEVQSCRGGGSCTISSQGREGKKLWGGRERELWCRV
jgi:SET domain-containing protein